MRNDGERCGEATFSRTTTEKVRRLVHGEGRPVRTVPMDVFAMARRISNEKRTHTFF